MSPIYHTLQPSWSCAPAQETINDTATTSTVAFAFDASAVTNNCSCPPVRRCYRNPDDFYSLARHFTLVCDDQWKVETLMPSVLIPAGGLCGALTFGYLADRFGRKWIGIITFTGTALVTFIISWSVNFEMVAVFSTLLGFFGIGYQAVSQLTVMECVGKDYRLLTTSLNGWSNSLMLIALLGYATKSWHTYHLSLAICGIPLIIARFWVVESPRWLIRMNRLEEAKKSIVTIAWWNNVMSPVSEREDRLLPALYELESANREKSSDYNYFDLLKYRRLRRYILVLTYTWFTSTIMSFSIYPYLSTFFWVIYFNTFLSGLCKTVSGFLPVLFDACGIGRKPTILTATAVVSVAMWSQMGVCVYLGEKPNHGSMAFLMTIYGISGLAADPVWRINYLYATELFPTVVRSMAYGVCNAAASLSIIIEPEIAALEKVYLPAPYIVFGILTILQLAILAKYLPEYRGKVLRDNLPENKRGQLTKQDEQ